MKADIDNIKVLCLECCDYMNVYLILKNNWCKCSGCGKVLVKLK